MISCPLKYLSGYGLYHILPAGAFLFSATAVMPYISSYSIYMVGVTDKFHFFYFYIFYFRSECGKIILHKYKFLSYVLSQKHNTMNLLFMLFFYFFFHPHTYYRAYIKKDGLIYPEYTLQSFYKCINLKFLFKINSIYAFFSFT